MTSPAPWAVLRAAVEKVPALKYAVAVVGLAAAIAIVRTFGIDPRTAVFGSILLVVLMALVVAFAALAASKSPHVRAAGIVLLWASLTLTILTASLLFTATFIDFPKPIHEILEPAPPRHREDSSPRLNPALDCKETHQDRFAALRIEADEATTIAFAPEPSKLNLNVPFRVAIDEGCPVVVASKLHLVPPKGEPWPMELAQGPTEVTPGNAASLNADGLVAKSVLKQFCPHFRARLRVWKDKFAANEEDDISVDTNEFLVSLGDFDFCTPTEACPKGALPVHAGNSVLGCMEERAHPPTRRKLALSLCKSGPWQLCSHEFYRAACQEYGDAALHQDAEEFTFDHGSQTYHGCGASGSSPWPLFAAYRCCSKTSSDAPSLLDLESRVSDTKMVLVFHGAKRLATSPVEFKLTKADYLRADFDVDHFAQAVSSVLRSSGTKMAPPYRVLLADGSDWVPGTSPMYWLRHESRLIVVEARLIDNTLTPAMLAMVAETSPFFAGEPSPP